MATLKELCSNIPTQISRQAVQYELLRRQVASYRGRMDALRTEEHVFDRCKQRRPEKGKYKNRVWAEECGCGESFVATVRTPNSYIHVACKVKK